MAIRDIVQAAAGVGGDKLYVEDVFSTYLYEGNGATQTITNGIDLDGEGGLVWIKKRNASQAHCLLTTDIDLPTNIYYPINFLSTNADNATSDIYGGGGTAPWPSSYLSNGFSLYNNQNYNGSGNTYTSWTFRKAPKFFDVVTYTGDGTTSNQIAHSLDATPGMIVVKRTDSLSNWAVAVYNGSNYDILQLNLTNGRLFTSSTSYYTSTYFDAYAMFQQFTDVPANDRMNVSGATYVAYLFAHDAGGFGDDGEQDVISCGSFTTDSNQDADINLGYEPQFILVKRSASQGDWWLIDNMRGMSVTDTNYLSANTAAADASIGGTGFINPTATGFSTRQGIGSSAACIYIAIRRPMKTPESGTEVYNAIAWTGNSTNPRSLTGVGFAPDLTLFQAPASGTNWNWYDRLRGPTKRLLSNATVAESTRSTGITSFNMDGITFSSDYNNNGLASQTWFFKRAPGFFDEVAFTQVGIGSVQTINHNLTVVPELIIFKTRGGGDNWRVRVGSYSGGGILNSNSGFSSSLYATNLTSTTFGFNQGTAGYSSGMTFVSYLFATLAGVSKVGSYTGTGADLNVDCGFSAGARFILIKRTDPGSTGDWYVWDSVRGISAGNDPYILLNNALAQVTNTDYIDPLASGFTVTSSAPAALNASGGSYLFLAIA